MAAANAAGRRITATIGRNWITAVAGLALRTAPRSLRAVDDGMVDAGARRTERPVRSRVDDRMGVVAVDRGPIPSVGRMGARTIRGRSGRAVEKEAAFRRAAITARRDSSY